VQVIEWWWRINVVNRMMADNLRGVESWVLNLCSGLYPSALKF
jgi:hypothetical protein